ncbi:MAG: hypothetical protein DRP97_03870 [Candidatus Latescibacterota bacterium]|nr:MAG: hypothetical protein DRP97_03870 [Candidatus Latescibacterota bacterium]
MKKLTKWGTGLVVAIAMMFMAGQAGAVTLGNYDTGQLVPKAYHDGSSVNTVVGITCNNAAGCHVYWTFFDNNSTHITDGMFEMTANDYQGFSWMDESGVGLEGVDGYLVFTSGVNATDTPVSTNDIFANAFYVDAAGQDAVVVPVLPINNTDYVSGTVLSSLTGTSIKSLASGTDPGKKVDIRYWIDPAYSATTTVVLWSVCDVSDITSTVDMYNDAEARKSVNFKLINKELNLMEPGSIQGRPEAFNDGFMRFTVPVGKCDPAETKNDMFVFSYIDSSLIGAMQTLLGGEL